MKCIVYNIENPDAKEFTVCVNEKLIHAQTGVEIDLKPEYIHVLENAIVNTMVRNPETNKAEPFKMIRFRIIKLDAEKNSGNSVGKTKFNEINQIKFAPSENPLDSLFPEPSNISRETFDKLNKKPGRPKKKLEESVL